MCELKEHLETPSALPPYHLSLNIAVSFLLPIIVSLRHGGGKPMGTITKRKTASFPQNSHLQHEFASCVIWNRPMAQGQRLPVEFTGAFLKVSSRPQALARAGHGRD